MLRKFAALQVIRITIQTLTKVVLLGCANLILVNLSAVGLSPGNIIQMVDGGLNVGLGIHTRLIWKNALLGMMNSIQCPKMTGPLMRTVIAQ